MRSEDPEAQTTAHQLVHCVLEADPADVRDQNQTVREDDEDRS